MFFSFYFVLSAFYIVPFECGFLFFSLPLSLSLSLFLSKRRLKLWKFIENELRITEWTKHRAFFFNFDIVETICKCGIVSISFFLLLLYFVGVSKRWVNCDRQSFSTFHRTYGKQKDFINNLFEMIYEMDTTVKGKAIDLSFGSQWMKRYQRFYNSDPILGN